jgi:hypothetical protein
VTLAAETLFMAGDTTPGIPLGLDGMGDQIIRAMDVGPLGLVLKSPLVAIQAEGFLVTFTAQKLFFSCSFQRIIIFMLRVPEAAMGLNLSQFGLIKQVHSMALFANPCLRGNVQGFPLMTYLALLQLLELTVLGMGKLKCGSYRGTEQ